MDATKKKKFDLKDIEIMQTLGLGSFGRVRLCKSKKGQHYAIKILKKAEIIRLKQVDHVLSEIIILSQIEHPFIVPSSTD